MMKKILISLLILGCGGILFAQVGIDGSLATTISPTPAMWQQFSYSEKLNTVLLLRAGCGAALYLLSSDGEESQGKALALLRDPNPGPYKTPDEDIAYFDLFFANPDRWNKSYSLAQVYAWVLRQPGK